MKGRKLAHIERGSSEKWLLYSSRIEIARCRALFLSLKSALHFLGNKLLHVNHKAEGIIFFSYKSFLSKTFFFLLWPMASPHPVRFMSFLVELRNLVVVLLDSPFWTHEKVALLPFVPISHHVE